MNLVETSNIVNSNSIRVIANNISMPQCQEIRLYKRNEMTTFYLREMDN